MAHPAHVFFPHLDSLHYHRKALQVHPRVSAGAHPTTTHCSVPAPAIPICPLTTAYLAPQPPFTVSPTLLLVCLGISRGRKTLSYLSSVCPSCSSSVTLTVVFVCSYQCHGLQSHMSTGHFTTRVHLKHQMLRTLQWCPSFPSAQVTKSLSEPKHHILLKNTVGHREDPTLDCLHENRERHFTSAYVCAHLLGD